MLRMPVALLVAVPLAAVAADHQRGATLQERVDVPRVLLDVRVIADSGEPVTDLTAADFAVRLGGRAVAVESAEWVPDAPRPHAVPGAEGAAPPRGASAEAPSLVILVQRRPDLSDAVGLMRLETDLGRFVDRLPPGTRAAVLSFDTRLHVWLDFTGETARVRSVLRREMLTGRPRGSAGLTGAGGHDLSAADAAVLSSVEAALGAVGAVLGSRPGTRTVVIVGHGLGEWAPRIGAVELDRDYDGAIAALREARASVFCIDVTRADYHPLQEGLVRLAADTGGRYWQSHIFTTTSFDRLERALSGHYVLFVVPPPDSRSGERSVSVRLAARRGTVLAQRTYVAP